VEGGKRKKAEGREERRGEGKWEGEGEEGKERMAPLTATPGSALAR